MKFYWFLLQLCLVYTQHTGWSNIWPFTFSCSGLSFQMSCNWYRTPKFFWEHKHKRYKHSTNKAGAPGASTEGAEQNSRRAANATTRLLNFRRVKRANKGRRAQERGRKDSRDCEDRLSEVRGRRGVRGRGRRRYLGGHLGSGISLHWRGSPCALMHTSSWSLVFLLYQRFIMNKN